MNEMNTVEYAALWYCNSREAIAFNNLQTYIYIYTCVQRSIATH